MRELIQFLPVLVIIIAVVSMIRNAAKAVRKTGGPTAAPRRPADFDPDLGERTRRIQEEIRRKIAERRGHVAPAPMQVPGSEPAMEPPVMLVRETREAPAVDMAMNAVLVRQQQLADQMRTLEQARALEQRRAAQITAGLRTEADSRSGRLTVARASLLADLRDPVSLRRAIVLREVLGTPVGLR